ncbi:MAG TPA: FAD-dependent oxidoreductase [Magnetospirillum sp.]|nr:FAD-dependent oxidoreductase [Magnetospirillum sp.]
MTGTLHVIGSGLAGLAAAVAGARAGWRVAMHEAAPHAGGRCRSFRCHRLDRVVDNGSHLLLGANRHALAFAAAIGGHETLERAEPVFPFLDLASRRHWVVRPGTLAAGLGETVSALGLPWVPRMQSVATRLGHRRAYSSLWKPLCEAILNTPPEHASARLLACVLREVLLGGKTAMRPYLATGGLSALFAAPAVATLAAHGAQLRFGHRLLAVHPQALEFDDGMVAMGENDRAVLAVPAWTAAGLLPELPLLPSAAIVNAHFLLDSPAVMPGGQPFLGLVGGMAQWLFMRDDVISVTVSAADTLAALPAEDIATILWAEIAPILRAEAHALPAVRVIKERRATLSHTPEVVARRPGAVTNVPWLWLAGDWLASPWPCTMEAAIVSGLAATRLAVGRDDLSFA